MHIKVFGSDGHQVSNLRFKDKKVLCYYSGNFSSFRLFHNTHKCIPDKGSIEKATTIEQFGNMHSESSEWEISSNLVIPPLESFLEEITSYVYKYFWTDIYGGTVYNSSNMKITQCATVRKLLTVIYE